MSDITIKKSFASDTNAGTHPKILEAMVKANTGHYVAYGEDPFTKAALKKFKEVFGPLSETYFVFNGTGANVTSLSAMGCPYYGVICAETAHIHVDECGAPERFAGCKLIVLPSKTGKLTPSDIEKTLYAVGVEHHAQPRIVSITNATEVGTVYTVEELKDLTSFAHRHEMMVHMDGARIANAAASLNVSLRELTTDAGIDILSFGGTKNGMMFGEAVVIFRPELAKNFKYIRKQAMQLASKMRYIGAQFSALFEDDLWLHNARQANRMARLLAEGVSRIPGVVITRPVEANGVFVKLPEKAVPRIMEKYFFYCMDEANAEYRWLASYDMEEEDINEFIKTVREAVE